MNPDNPFQPFGGETADDETIVQRPSLGGRVKTPTPTTSPMPTPPRPLATEPLIPPVTIPPAPPRSSNPAPERFSAIAQWHDVTTNLLPQSHNPLTGLMQPLLLLVARLRELPIHQAIAELQEQLVLEIKNLTKRAISLGFTAEHVQLASYGICSLLDETILNTPWGAQSFWGNQTLLSLFHKEAWGGEKFFLFLDKMSKQPVQHLHLLELYYLLLSLGFEGKYRVIANGVHGLEKERNEAYELVKRLRGDFERDLSPRWQGVSQQINPIARYVPSWVIIAATFGMLLLIYLAFLLPINSLSEPVFTQVLALGSENYAWNFPKPAAPFPVQQSPDQHYQNLLADEINRRMVEVVGNRVLRIRYSFDSASDHIKPDFLIMLNKISRELAKEPGVILVTGHCDDRPIASIRFPSNWHLSSARAKKVADILLDNPGLAGRVKFEGRADNEPLVTNDTPDNRALNRRVDIHIRAKG